MIRIVNAPHGSVLAVGDRAESTIQRYLDDARSARLQPSEAVLGDAPLAVPWQPPGGAVTPLDRVCWRTHYTPFVGREADQAAILEWAESGDGVRARMLVGDAGVGKSRLAAEVATILQGEGWAAGIVGWNDGVVWRMGGTGTFVVLDDAPWPQESCWNALTRAVGEVANSSQRVRVLLLSRVRPEGQALPPGISIQQLEPLSVEAAVTLHEWVVEDYCPADVARPWRAFSERVAKAPQIARHPLYAIASALFVSLPPWDGHYPRHAHAAVVGLAHATWRALNRQAERVGLAADVLPLLVALAAACDGLSEDDLRRLAGATSLTTAEPDEFVERVSHLSMWRGDRLETCLDGLPRGEFLRQAFTDAHHRGLGVRIRAAKPVTSLAHLALLDRDVSDAGADARLCRFLAEMLPVRNLDLDLCHLDWPRRAGSLLGLLALRASEGMAPAIPVAVSHGVTDDDHAEALIRLARHLAREEGPEAAIAPAREAVKLYRVLLDRHDYYRADLDDASALLQQCVDGTIVN